MTAQELIDFIHAFGFEDWLIEVKVHGELYTVHDMAGADGFIRLYTDTNEDGEYE